MSEIEFVYQMQANGVVGLFVGLLVLVAIYILQYTNLLKAGWMRRAAAVILSALLSGVKVGDEKSALIGLIATITATFGHTLIELLIVRAKQLQQPKA